MNWGDLKGVIGKAAPILGTLVGGPAGGAVGALIAAGLGVNPTPDEVSDALLKNPDAYVKLQEIEANNRIQLQQLAVTAESNRLQAANVQFAAEAADRDSARKLAAAQPNDYTRQILTYAVTALIAGVVVMIFAGTATVRELLKDPVISLTIGTLLGYLFNEWKQMLGFWFGATREGQQQTNAITQFAVSPGSVTTPDATTTVSTSAPITVQAGGSATEAQAPVQP